MQPDSWEVELSYEAQETYYHEIDGHPKLESLFRKIRWQVALNPEIGERLPNSERNFWVARLEPNFDDLAAIVICYRFNEDVVTIEFISLD